MRDARDAIGGFLNKYESRLYIPYCALLVNKLASRPIARPVLSETKFRSFSRSSSGRRAVRRLGDSVSFIREATMIFEKKRRKI